MNCSRLVAVTLLAAFCLFNGAAMAATSEGRVEFELFREGYPFGRQSVVVSSRNGQLFAQTAANLRAALGPVTMFSYTQSCSETWRSGALTSLRWQTRQNGRHKLVEGRLNGDAFHVSGVDGAIAFDPRTLPTSWWTRPPLSTREMINSETGARLPVRVSFVGRETIAVGNQRIAADHIRVQGTLTVDLWYDDAGHWVGCAFTAQGQRITYRLLTSPADAPA